MSPARDYYLPSRQLVSQNDSAIIQEPHVPRSKFMGAWTRKTTFDAGYLVPIMVEEILPGDSMRYNVTAYVRMSTPLFPIFDNQRVDTFFFFVPNRLLWVNWQKFMGEQANPADSIAFTIPERQNTGYALNSLGDHMGIPGINQITLATNHNVLPFRAYQLIYNTWFRDQNIINSAVVSTADGPDTTTSTALQKRAKSHDYFTSALPWPQKFTAPNVPLAGLAPIRGLGSATGVGVAGPVGSFETDGTVAFYNSYNGLNGAFPTDIVMQMNATGGPNNLPLVFADLTAATGVSINTLRQAWMVQSLLERDARGGTRYVELIRAHFGVTNPDFRLQRPEYIGGGQTPLQITPVAQTTPTAGATVGALGAAATAAGNHSANYAATEHGYIIGIINIKSELSYQQGLHKMWSRSTRFDFYWPSLAQLGEQAILRKELYQVGDPALDNLVFGYQERWHEYRTRYSEVTGTFRSTATGTFDAWHLAQRFTSPPLLNQTFIEDTPPMDRVLAAGATAVNEQYLADILIQRTAVRPIPMFGTPASMGRF